MSESELIAQTEKTFEDIKHVDENGNEYWYARELQSALQYSEWRKFEGVIENPNSHFFLQINNNYAIIRIIENVLIAQQVSRLLKVS